ncbi:MAG: carbon-nitrogen family hydrolase [Actinomycetota bacterium]|nr:carbon-nitrogen family hydrolase [Actinomycetota bacterium]
MQLRIAGIQHDIVWGDRDANFERLAPKIAAAAAAGARLVSVTETFSTGFVVDDPELGEPEGGPSSSFLAAQATEHDVWVAGSCPELPADLAPGDEDRRPYNSLVIAGPRGEMHRYRKIHPFTYGGEERSFRAGSEFVSVQIDGLRVTPFVCYDLRFADEFWATAHDTDLYLVPANWPAARRAHWRSLLVARAIENQAYVVGVNRVGSGGGLDYTGDSRIIDPLGEVLAGAAQTESIVLADIDPATVADVRTRFRFLDDRR